MSGSWVKLYRSIDKHWIWNCEPYSKGQAWLDLLIHARFEDGEITIKGKQVKLKRGEQARSELTLMSKWKWSRGKVRRFLKTLKTEHMIVQHSTQLTSVISICNYNIYQSSMVLDGTTDGTTDGTSVGTSHSTSVGTRYKNDKNIKKEKNVKKTNTSPAAHSSAQDDLFAQFWNAYPVKKDKGRCRKIWAKIKPDQFMTNDIVSAIENQKGERMVLEDRNEFVPCWKNPSTWLNGQCWEDEPSEKAVEIQKDNDLIEKFLNGEKPDNVILGDFKW